MSTQPSQSDDTLGGKTTETLSFKTSSTFFPSINFVDNAMLTRMTLDEASKMEKYLDVEKAAKLFAQSLLIFDYFVSMDNRTKNPNDTEKVHEWYFCTEKLAKREKMTKWERDIVHKTRSHHLETLKGSYGDFIPVVEKCAEHLDGTFKPYRGYKYRKLNPNELYHAQKPSEHFWDWIDSRDESFQTYLSESYAKEYEKCLERMRNEDLETPLSRLTSMLPAARDFWPF